MRKFYSFTLLMSLIFLTACTSNAQSDTSISNNSSNQTQTDIDVVEEHYIFESETIDFRLLYELTEKEPHPAIEDVIIHHYFDSPEEIPENVFYAYQFVDLNDDDSSEVIVILSGSYFSGNGGDTMLILSQNNDSWQVVSSHTLVREPMIISDNKSNGYHNIIFRTSGGGHEIDYHIFEHDGTQYPINPSVQSTIENEVASGISIFSDLAFNESFSERIKILHPLKK